MRQTVARMPTLRMLVNIPTPDHSVDYSMIAPNTTKDLSERLGRPQQDQRPYLWNFYSQLVRIIELIDERDMRRPNCLNSQ